MSDEKRVFVAVNVSDPARTAVAEYVESLRRNFPNVRCRWVVPENLHITAWFIGNVKDESLTAWKDSVSLAAAGVAPFQIELVGTGTFAQHRLRTDVLWIGVVCEPADSFRQIGLHMHEDARVKPHLTIGRLKRSSGADGLLTQHCSAEFGPISFSVGELVIFESELTPTGSVYTPIYRAELVGQTYP